MTETISVGSFGDSVSSASLRSPAMMETSSVSVLSSYWKTAWAMVTKEEDFVAASAMVGAVESPTSVSYTGAHIGETERETRRPASIVSASKIELGALLLGGMIALIVGLVALAYGNSGITIVMIPPIVAALLGSWLLAGAARIEKGRYK